MIKLAGLVVRGGGDARGTLAKKGQAVGARPGRGIGGRGAGGRVGWEGRVVGAHGGALREREAPRQGCSC
eukprot:10170338-Alexandrium_andersonii.AAC.1